MNSVQVIDINYKPLANTNYAKARILIKKNKAIKICNEPMTIQLKGERQ